MKNTVKVFVNSERYELSIARYLLFNIVNTISTLFYTTCLSATNRLSRRLVYYLVRSIIFQDMRGARDARIRLKRSRARRSNREKTIRDFRSPSPRFPRFRVATSASVGKLSECISRSRVTVIYMLMAGENRSFREASTRASRNSSKAEGTPRVFSQAWEKEIGGSIYLPRDDPYVRLTFGARRVSIVSVRQRTPCFFLPRRGSGERRQTVDSVLRVVRLSRSTAERAKCAEREPARAISLARERAEGSSALIRSGDSAAGELMGIARVSFRSRRLG